MASTKDLLPFPVLTVEQDYEMLIWTGEIVLDGKPFPWAVLLGSKFEMTADGVATLTVSIPVRLRIVPKGDGA